MESNGAGWEPGWEPGERKVKEVMMVSFRIYNTNIV